jgi:hypothetical protein
MDNHDMARSDDASNRHGISLPSGAILHSITLNADGTTCYEISGIGKTDDISDEDARFCIKKTADFYGSVMSDWPIAATK